MKVRERIEEFGGRRCVLAVCVWIGTTALQWFANLDPSGTTYGLTLAATVAAYITGNTAQKNAAATKEQADK